MHKRYPLFVTVLSFIIFGVVFYSLESGTRATLLKTTPGPLFASTSPAGATSGLEVRTIRVGLSAGTTTYEVSVPAGSTVLDAMRALAARGFSFTGREYPSLGFFVESINGKKNADGFYWFLYVNEKSSDTGASQTALTAGDAVEWNYEKNH